MTDYKVKFPAAVTRIAKAFSVFNVSPFTFIKLSCRADGFDEFNRLVLITAVPAIIIGVLFVASWLLSLHPPPSLMRLRLVHKIYHKKKACREWELRLFNWALFTSYICLPSVAATIANAYNCIDFDDGSSFLAVDFRLECHSSRYRRMVAYATAMLVVFPIGIPCFYFFTLWKHRETLYPRNSGRAVTIDSIGDRVPVRTKASLLCRCRRGRGGASGAAAPRDVAAPLASLLGPPPPPSSHAVRITVHLKEEHVKPVTVRSLVRAVAAALLKHRARRLCMSWCAAPLRVLGCCAACRRCCRGVEPKHILTEMHTVLAPSGVPHAAAPPGAGVASGVSGHASAHAMPGRLQRASARRHLQMVKGEASIVVCA